MEFHIDFYSIILIMPLTIMVLMKYAEKCPKCGGFVQTKSLNKSIGFGSVDIPVARRPEDIKEGYHLKAPFINGKMPRINTPVLSRNHMIALGSIVAIILIYFLISFLMPVSNVGNEKIPQAAQFELSNNTINITPTATTATTVTRLHETPKVTSALTKNIRTLLAV
jgi:hypothetical protein